MENSECLNLDPHQGDKLESKKPYSFSVVPYNIEQHLEFIEFSTEGHLLLGSSNLVNRNWTGSVWLFSNGDVAPLKEESISGHGCESCVPTGKFLDSWDKIIVGEDTGKITVFDIAKFEDGSAHFLPQKNESQHDGCITSIEIIKNKQAAISAGSDMKINVWDYNTLEVLHKFYPAHSMEITSISSPNTEGMVFASCSLDGLALLWDLKQSKPASAITQHDLGLTSITWKDDNTIFAGTIAGEIIYFDIRNKKEFNRLLYHKHSVHQMSINNSLGLLAVCGNSNVIKVWDTNTSELIYTDTEHEGLVRDLAWNPVNNKLYSCGFDKKIISHAVPSVDKK